MRAGDEAAQHRFVRHGYCFSPNERLGTARLQREVIVMLYYALVFLVLALVAGFFGFGGVAGTAASIAQVLFAVFLIALIVSVVANAIRGRSPTSLV
jgi:uncharacterized membrane protein YtjA (UPF0391 family)